MKHAVILAHPASSSLNASIAKLYCERVRSKGDEVLVRDLYAINFHPCLLDSEIPRPSGFSPGEDVVAERAMISDAEVFAFIYPLWFYAPPAILKGYIDRVFGMGFGYGSISGGGNKALLAGRAMLSFTTSGAPLEWVKSEGALDALRNIFDDHLANVCGLTVLDHVHLGGITPHMRADVVERGLNEVTSAVDRLFPRRAA